MGKRLSKIVTKTGDEGLTGLGDGSRVPKFDLRVEVMGHVDELNSHLGLLIELMDSTSLAEERHFLRRCQHYIFDLGGEISIPGFELITSAQVEHLETAIDEYNEPLPALENFILPGGSLAVAQAHVVRSVCRRAERTLMELASTETVNVPCKQLLNRFSDLMFVMARHITRVQGVEEVLWEQDKSGR